MNFERHSQIGLAKGTRKPGRYGKPPTLGGGSRIFLLEASPSLQERGLVLSLFQQIWDSLMIVSVAPCGLHVLV